MKIWVNIKSIALIALLSLPFGMAQADESKMGQSYEPIISHELSSNIPYLLALSAMDKEARKLASQAEADKLYAVSEDAIKNLGDQDATIAPNNGLYKDQMALLVYFLSNTHAKANLERVPKVADWLDKTAGAYAAASKQANLAALANFYAMVGRFVKTNGTDGISELVPLRDKLAGQTDAQNSIDLFVGYSLAMSAATSAQGLQTMNKVANSVSVYGRVAGKLTEAMIEYGLDADGNPLSTAKTGAETKLTYCVQLARGMPLGLQLLVMNTSTFIWTKATPNMETRAPAFLKEGFTGVMPVEALRERDALIELRAQNYPKASALYKGIAAAFPRGEILTAIDSRIWDMDVLSYQKSGKLPELEVSFLALRQKYAGQKKGFYATLGESYRKILEGALDAAVMPKAAPAQQQMAVLMSSRYLKTEADRGLAAPLKIKLALLYRSVKMYKEAVDLYLDLAKDSDAKYYLLAIESQSQLAQWPSQPVFGAPKKDLPGERTRLLSIYETVNQLKNGGDWFFVAHVGLLQRSLGQSKAAEVLWLKTLKVNVGSKFALEAAGLLLTEFNATNRYDEVIDLSHLMASKKVTPTLDGKAINYRPWLADALFKGGNAELNKKNLPKAAKYLEEFTIVFPTEPRMASASHSLALAYKGMNKLVPALNVSKNIVEKFPGYQLRSGLILQAAEWASADRTTWEYAFYFYGKYLADYKTAKNIPQIRTTLAELYYKRKLYGWASRLYKEQSVAPNVARDQQLAAAVRAMEIEEQFGEQKEAYANAQRVVVLAGTTHAARFKAYAFMGRFVANAKDLKGMADLEPKLLANARFSKEVVEAIGFIRFRRAELSTKGIANNENNLQIRDPEATVKKYFDRFDSERKGYLAVCQVGVTAYCAPAMYRLLAVAKQGYEAVDKIQIAQTLGASRINSFKVFKQLHLQKIQQAHKEYADKAVSLAKQGTTTPAWKVEITRSLEVNQSLAH